MCSQCKRIPIENEKNLIATVCTSLEIENEWQRLEKSKQTEREWDWASQLR